MNDGRMDNGRIWIFVSEQSNTELVSRKKRWLDKGVNVHIGSISNTPSKYCNTRLQDIFAS